MKYFIVIMNLICLTKCTVEHLVVGGEVAQIRQFPHSGFLSVSCGSKTSDSWSCGASIVNQKIILTAAHCVKSCNKRGKISVSVGNRIKHAGIMSSVQSIFCHKDYNVETLHSDIALLELRTALQFTTAVKRLAFMANPPLNEKAYVAGWGWIKEEAPIKTTNQLFYVDQYVVDRQACSVKLNLKQVLPAGSLCARSKKGTSYASGCNKEHEPGWICGSSIINQRILLTAAHCVASCWNQNTMTISVGHNHKKKGAVSSVQRFFMHDEYLDGFVAFDIAVIRVKRNLKFSLDVRRVALMRKPPYFEKAQVAGWGSIKESPEIPTNTLQYMDQYIWAQDKCRNVHKMPRGALCASSKSYSAYGSGGDSGSALVVRGYIQIGLVSYKMPAVSKSLVIYTDTGYFYDWIVKTAKKLYCSKQQ